jgi:hypothetical protein
VFKAAEEYLVHLGFEVINPLTPEDKPFPEDGKVDDKMWLTYIIRDMRLIANCDILYQLPDWERSFGAQIEHFAAVRFKKLIMCHEDWSYAADKEEDDE